MPQKRIPKLCHHKPTGQAFVRLNGQMVYLGDYDNPNCQQRYAAAIAEWLDNGRELPAPPDQLTITELCLAYWKHAQIYYQKPEGDCSSTINNVKQALRPIRELYGATVAADFGPSNLRAIQSEIIRQGLSRSTINSVIRTIRRMYKWAASREMIPPSTWHGLLTVDHLKAGRSEAKESRKIRPVSREKIDAVIPHLSPVVASMVELQWLTGMRPGEVCRMRPIDIDHINHPWSYNPEHHKTEHRGHTRQIFIGPKAQGIIQSFLDRDPYKPLFSPAESQAWHRHQRSLNRVTDLQFGNRIGTNRKRNPKRRPSIQFDANSYRQSVERACDIAFPPPESLSARIKDNGKLETKREFFARLTPEEKTALWAWQKSNRWHPHQLRHAAATRLRAEHGLEVAALALGHSSATITDAVYAERDLTSLKRIVSQTG